MPLAPTWPRACGESGAIAELCIIPLESDAEARACAELMAGSEPWITLGRGFEASLAIVRDPTREVYVARDDSGIAGFLILCLTGAFVGYIQTVCIDPRCRSKGFGSRLVEFAERRILEVSPNIFMCVSSFNHDARRLYQRLGYHIVGELTDYLVKGHSEVLLRKSIAPLAGFVRTSPNG
jgi:ribosomal protein S18 acetylase RimI-like enzyme